MVSPQAANESNAVCKDVVVHPVLHTETTAPLHNIVNSNMKVVDFMFHPYGVAVQIFVAVQR